MTCAPASLVLYKVLRPAGLPLSPLTQIETVSPILTHIFTLQSLISIYIQVLAVQHDSFMNSCFLENTATTILTTQEKQTNQSSTSLYESRLSIRHWWPQPPVRRCRLTFDRLSASRSSSRLVRRVVAATAVDVLPQLRRPTHCQFFDHQSVTEFAFPLNYVDSEASFAFPTRAGPLSVIEATQIRSSSDATALLQLWAFSSPRRLTLFVQLRISFN
jgi:hypothetical protein